MGAGLRRAAAVAAVLVLVLCPLAARDMSAGGSIGDNYTIGGEDTANPFGEMLNYFQRMFLGAVAGLLVGIRYVISIVSAYIHRDEDPAGVKKAMARLLPVVIVCSLAAGFVPMMFGIGHSQTPALPISAPVQTVASIMAAPPGGLAGGLHG